MVAHSNRYKSAECNESYFILGPAFNIDTHRLYIHCALIFDVTSRTNSSHFHTNHMLRLSLATQRRHILTQTPNKTKNYDNQKFLSVFVILRRLKQCNKKTMYTQNVCREWQKRPTKRNIRKITEIKVSYGCFTVRRLDLSKNISFIIMSFSLDSHAGRHNPNHLLEKLKTMFCFVFVSFSHFLCRSIGIEDYFGD